MSRKKKIKYIAFSKQDIRVFEFAIQDLYTGLIAYCTLELEQPISEFLFLLDVNPQR